ncbi:DUF6233 domain-containing protein [Streptomyces rubrogriseus]|uniref:DUF6233 domain-containing protein n=1 Tax=Streptomyces rubrogriseus TaxID=194673 RepID=UPI0037CDCC61
MSLEEYGRNVYTNLPASSWPVKLTWQSVKIICQGMLDLRRPSGNRPSIIERVSDTPSRLELLQFTRRVVEQQAWASLRQLDRWIADEERLEAERRQAEERRPPPPEWLIERGLDRTSLVAVHTGDCWDPGKRLMPATREQARDAIRQQVPACSKCRPDTRLGLLE